MKLQRRPTEEVKKLNALFGSVAIELGYAAERRVTEVFEEKKRQAELPQWLLKWERQQPCSPMDEKGVDFIFTTDVGPVYLQIKSSAQYAAAFARKHLGSTIRVVVIDFREPLGKTFSKVMREIKCQREQIQRGLASTTI